MSTNLVIVESPAKAKTIEKYLGKDFKVLASYGHVRDLIPKEGAVDPDLINYIDHVRMYPQNPNFIAEQRDIDINAGGTARLERMIGEWNRVPDAVRRTGSAATAPVSSGPPPSSGKRCASCRTRTGRR